MFAQLCVVSMLVERGGYVLVSSVTIHHTRANSGLELGSQPSQHGSRDRVSSLSPCTCALSIAIAASNVNANARRHARARGRHRICWSVQSNLVREEALELALQARGLHE